MHLSNFNKMIKFAIRKEQEAATMYETYASLVKSSGIKRMFQELAEEEKKHKKLLEGVSQQDVENYELTDVTNLRIAEYTIKKRFSQKMDFQDALLLAIHREEKSYNLYNRLAKGTDNAQLRKLLQALAQEEAKHKLKLESEYDEHIYKWD